MLFSLLGVRLISPQYKIRMQYNIHYIALHCYPLRETFSFSFFFAHHIIPSQEHRKDIFAILALSEELFRWTPNRIESRLTKTNSLRRSPSFTTSQRPFVVLSLLLLLILLFDSYWLRLRGETTKVFFCFLRLNRFFSRLITLTSKRKRSF